MRFIGVDVEQETSAPPPKKNPGSTPVLPVKQITFLCHSITNPNRPDFLAMHYYRHN